ncbi:hypothetical protein [Variovorax sp. R-27]|uniref:hypothetical protein n=1 Tax=Variovorax sp. R-27 TaxID=3404058 RepID=UPI003CF6B019
MSTMPTVQQWKLSRAIPLEGPPLSPPEWAVIESLDFLVEQFNSLRHADIEDQKLTKALVALHITFATNFWLRKHSKTFKTGPTDFIGQLRISPREYLTDAIMTLRKQSIDKWNSFLKTPMKISDEDLADNNYLWSLIYEDELAIGVSNKSDKGVDDQAYLEGMPKFSEKATRIKYKARFRHGLLWRSKSLLPLDELEFSLYDSHASNEAEGNDGLVHYAMDMRGRIYIGYRKDVTFFHSAFAEKDYVLCAGKMEVKNGQISFINNASGHYFPRGKNLVTLLHRLRVYGVNLDKVVVGNWVGEKTYMAKKFLENRGFPGEKMI